VDVEEAGAVRCKMAKEGPEREARAAKRTLVSMTICGGIGSF
jgi:hypothetical protein